MRRRRFSGSHRRRWLSSGQRRGSLHWRLRWADSLGLNNGTWTFSDSQRCWSSDCVSLTVLNDFSWFWTVGSVSSNNFSFSSVCDSTWAVCDGQSGWGSNGVSLTILFKSSWFWTVSSQSGDHGDISDQSSRVCELRSWLKCLRSSNWGSNWSGTVCTAEDWHFRRGNDWSCGGWNFWSCACRVGSCGCGL